MQTATPHQFTASGRPTANVASRRRAAAAEAQVAPQHPRTILHIPDLGELGQSAASAAGARQGKAEHGAPRQPSPIAQAAGAALPAIVRSLGQLGSAIANIQQPKLALAVVMAVGLQLIVLLALLTPPSDTAATPAPADTAVQTQTQDNTSQPTPAVPASTSNAKKETSVIDELPQLPQLDPRDVPPWEASAGNRHSAPVANQPATLDDAAGAQYRMATRPQSNTSSEPPVARLRGTIGQPSGKGAHEQAQPGLY